jgi:hypothetical protein
MPPSRTQWWALSSTAICPSGSPSTNSHDQRGRVRSKGHEVVGGEVEQRGAGGDREGRDGEVVVDVVVGIVHPDRPPEAARDRRQPLAVPAGQVHPTLGVLPDQVHPDAPGVVTERLAVEDQDRPDVHRGRGGVQGQEVGVEDGQTVPGHARSLGRHPIPPTAPVVCSTVPVIVR